MAVDDEPDAARTPDMDAITVAAASGWFWRTVLASWGIYVEVAIVTVLVNALALAAPIFAMIIIDRFVPRFSEETLWLLAAGAAVAVGFGFLLTLLRGYFVEAAGSAASERIGEQLFRRILAVKMAHRPRSDIALASAAGDLDDVRNLLSAAPILALIDLPFVGFFIFAIYAIGGQIALVPMAAVAAIAFCGLILQFPLRAKIRRAHGGSCRRLGLAIETVAGIESIKSGGWERRVLERWESLLGETTRASRAAKGITAGAASFAAMATTLVIVGVIAYGVYLIGAGSLSLGGLIAISMLAASAMAPLDRLVSTLSDFHRAQVAMRSINYLMQVPAERPVGRIYSAPTEISGAIAFQEVSFRYPGQESLAVDRVSFRIEAGEKVGLIGRVGSGKSTIVRLVMGLYEADAGVVAVDGADIQNVDPADLRAAIGIVPQDVHLFDGTVKENIAVGAPLSGDDAIHRSARIAGVDEFTGRHSMGYDMPVGERGQSISGGQRQAIAIARSLLRDPPILLLDEPTGSLDNTSEGRFRARLANEIGKKTLLLVTNRASMLELVDRVVVLDGGKIIADGAKQEVLDALQGGHIKPVAGVES